MTLSGPKSRDFEEPKVQGLWKIALNGDFTSEELESLRTELRHYEQRLQKLRFIQAQHSLQQAKTELGNKSEFQDANELRQRIKLQSRKVEKLHADLEARITQRHLELWRNLDQLGRSAAAAAAYFCFHLDKLLSF